MTERERFDVAFDAIIARGEKPTPKLLGLEMNGKPYRNMPGRLSRLRRERLVAAGYVQGEATASSLGRWYLL